MSINLEKVSKLTILTSTLILLVEVLKNLLVSEEKVFDYDSQDIIDSNEIIVKEIELADKVDNRQVIENDITDYNNILIKTYELQEKALQYANLPTDSADIINYINLLKTSLENQQKFQKSNHTNELLVTLETVEKIYTTQGINVDPG
jgi:hypothetical protein